VIPSTDPIFDEKKSEGSNNEDDEDFEDSEDIDEKNIKSAFNKYNKGIPGSKDKNNSKTQDKNNMITQNTTETKDVIKDYYNFENIGKELNEQHKYIDVQTKNILQNIDLKLEKLGNINNMHNLDENYDDDFDDDNDINENKKSSPVLDKETREKLINFGHSLDSKQLADALGYIDLRYLLRLFAKAINKHIEFSKGYLFMDDLKMEESRSITHLNTFILPFKILGFNSYIGQQLMIDVPKEKRTFGDTAIKVI
jgi:hypothetical protein